MHTHDINELLIQKSVEDKESSANIINEVHTHDINEVPMQKLQKIMTHMQILLMKCILVLLIMMYYYIITYYITPIK